MLVRKSEYQRSSQDSNKREAAGVSLTLILLLSFLLSSCAAPTTSSGSYRDKAQLSAQTMASIVSSADLAASLQLQGRSLSSVTNINVSDAESDADSVVSTFDSRQPPDAESTKLMQKVDTPLQAASSGLTQLRIAVRSRNATAMRRAIRSLSGPLKQLSRLQVELS